LDAFESLRREFIEKFSRQKLEDLTIEEYSLNAEDNNLSKESLCYWVEQKTRELGSIKGATAMKFGTYFGKKKPELNNRQHWASWTDGSFDVIRNALLELYDAGENENIEIIKRNKLSPMFKGKLLSLYFPNRFLNIFSSEHLHHFLNKLSISYSGKDDVVDLREKLIDYKNANPKYEELTAIAFGNELGRLYGWPPSTEIQFEQAEDLYEQSQIKVVNRSFKHVPGFTDTPEESPDLISTSYGQVFKINPAKSRRAIIDSGFSCEVDERHESFTRKDSEHKYTEAHHLIPRKHQRKFINSLDVIANIVSLCSNCHNCVHYGSTAERNSIIEKLFEKRQQRLSVVGLDILLSDLKKLY